MPRRLTHALLCALCLVLCVAGVTRADDIKKIHPTGYVTDLAGILQPQTRTQLEALCTELEQKTGAQMAVVTVNSLDGNDIETYAVDLYKQLGVGGKKNNEGVLLLVAPNDRKYRVEVGYGAEPDVTDARAGDAGRLMVPYFRRGDYSGGVAAAAWQLAKTIADAKGVTLSASPPIQPVRGKDKDESGGIGIWIVIGIILFVFLMSRSGGSGSNINRRGGGGGSGWWIGPMIGGGWGGGSRGGGGSWGGGGGGFGGFGGGMSGGGGASGSW